MIPNHRSERNYRPTEWFSTSPFIVCFPSDKRAVRRIKEGTSAILLQSGLDEEWWAGSMEYYCEKFKTFRHYHSSRTDGVVTCDDSVVGPHKICQIPMNCQYG